jgi:uncharacterized protein YidB (DUF937 family)
MTALLGLLALAGYQNRDKLAELLKGAGSKDTQPGANTLQGPLEDLLGSLSGAAAGGGVGGLLGADSENCWIGSSKTAKGMRRSLGSTKVPIKNFTHPS